MSEKTHGRKLVEELILKFPHAGNLTIAKLACREAPILFSNVEHARNLVRHSRGAIGKKERHKATMPPAIPFPKGKSRMAGWSPYKIKEQGQILVMSDLHIPYHNDDVLEAALSFTKPAAILLNGDIWDCHAVSKWETDPRERNFSDELAAMRSFLVMLRKRFPKTAIVYKLGNHEERLESYMIRKAPELFDVDVFSFDNILDLDELDIDLVDDKRRVTIGDLNVVHGHEYRFSISNPVNPARGLFLRARDYTLAGHFHQSSYHSGKTLSDNVIACWSTGCMCYLYPPYQPYNEWVNGFAVVELSGNKFQIENKVFRGGRLY